MSNATMRPLRLRRIGIDTYQEPVVYLRADSPICRSEGFEAHTRVTVANGGKPIVATLNVVTSDLLREGEVGLSDIISTGTTLIETVRILQAQGLKKPVCCAVHGLFAGDAYRGLQAAGVERIVTCNTVPHETNAIDLTAEIAAGVLTFLR